jgi:hypothetical protein
LKVLSTISTYFKHSIEVACGIALVLNGTMHKSLAQSSSIAVNAT